MVTYTTTYNLAKPTVGDDEDAWGGYLNGNFDTLESLLKGTTALTSLNLSGNITFGDNDKAIFGAGSDLQIYHNGTDSFIREVGTGGLKIDTNGPDITFRVNATENAIIANSNGSVELYYDNASKLATTSTGIDVTGNITVSGTVDGRDVATDGTKLDGIEASADVTDTANVTASGALMDSELTSEASVKAINQGLSTSDSPDFQSVVINSVSTTGSSFATGTQGFVTDGYIRLKGIVNFGENGSGPAAITFGDNSTYGADKISLVTAGNNAVFINGSQDVDIPNGTFSTSTAIGEKYTALSGTTPTADPDNGGAFSLTLSGNTTFTFGAPSLGSGYSTGFIIELTGNATTSYTVTWPASVEWKGGTAPDAPAVGETDILVFWTRDGGTTWYGVRSIDAAA